MNCRCEDDGRQRIEPENAELDLLVAGDTEEIDPGFLEDVPPRISVTRTETGGQALDCIGDSPVDCLLCTDQIADMDPLALIDRVRDRLPLLPIVLVAVDGSECLASEAVSAGVTEYLPAERARDTAEILDCVTRSVSETHRCIRANELDGIEAAVEHAADAIVITDPDGVIEYVNPAFEEVTGYNRRQAIGRTPRILKSGKQDESYYERMWDAILDGEVWEETITNETRTGDQFVAHQTVAPVVDDDGEIAHFVGIQRDVTRQKRLEEQLERSNAALSQLYEITSDEELDLEEKIQAVLSVGTRHLDFPIGYFTRIADGKQEILAAVGDHDKIQPGAVDPLERTYCRKTIRAEDPVTVSDAKAEGWEDDPAFERFGLQCYLGAKVVVDGEIYGTLCFAGEESKDELLLEAQQSTIQALANWIGYELDRERHKRKLERQNDRLEKFASAVSHDLRNPLNIAQAHAELRRENDDEKHIEKVTDAHERMETIIEDALTLAREGKLVETTEEVSLEWIADTCWDGVETDDAKLEIEGDVSLNGDPDKLRHIFENLFRNAVEHGPPDGRWQSDDCEKAAYLTVRVGPTESGFYVEDDGLGIPEDQREQVFEYGYSTDSGSGFGLSIVETIVDAHGWSVDVTESTDGGARFEFDTSDETETQLLR